MFGGGLMLFTFIPCICGFMLGNPDIGGCCGCGLLMVTAVPRVDGGLWFTGLITTSGIELKSVCRLWGGMSTPGDMIAGELENGELMSWLPCAVVGLPESARMSSIRETEYLLS